MLRKTVALRNQNPSLKVTLAIGGWNEGSVNYSIMARTQATRASFISSTLNIIQKYDLDGNLIFLSLIFLLVHSIFNEFRLYLGVDADWEYPARYYVFLRIHMHICT